MGTIRAGSPVTVSNPYEVAGRYLRQDIGDNPEVYRTGIRVSTLPTSEVFLTEGRITRASGPVVLTEVRDAHKRMPSGYCLCGLTPPLTPGQHERHLIEISQKG